MRWPCSKESRSCEPPGVRRAYHRGIRRNWIGGGGSAGAVLAARLSEDPARRVLLLEAGPDYASVQSTPPDLQDGWRMSLQAHDWGLTAEAVPGRDTGGESSEVRADHRVHHAAH